MGTALIYIMATFMVADMIGNGILHLMLPTTFIEGVHTTAYKKEEVYDLIGELNGIADSDVIKYEGVRAINIYDKPLKAFPKNYSTNKEFQVVGQAESSPYSCDITVAAELPHYILKVVLWHEIFHCFNFNHVDNRRDIMYHAPSVLFEKRNIKQYLNKIKEMSE